MTCAVAPHQVYGPRDNLFLPNILEARDVAEMSPRSAEIGHEVSYRALAHQTCRRAPLSGCGDGPSAHLWQRREPDLLHAELNIDNSRE